jgi:hypothetical protein
MSRLDYHVNKVQAKMLLTSMLRALAWSLLVYGGVVWLVILGSRLLGMAFPKPWIWLAASVSVAVIIAIVYAVMRKPTRELAAVAIDERLGLKEKFSTALYVRRSEDPFAAAAVKDAESTAERVHLQDKFPVQFPWVGFFTVGMAVVALLTAWLVPSMDLFGRKAQQAKIAEETKQVEAANRTIEKAITQIDQAPPVVQKDEKIQLALRELKELRAKPVKDPTTASRKAQEALEDVKQQLQKVKDIQQAAQAMNEMEAWKEMSKKPIDESGPIGKAQSSLAKGEFSKAVEQLKDVVDKFDKMDKKDQDKAAQQMAAMAQQLQQMANDPKQQQQLQKQLEKAGATQQQAQQIAKQMQQAAQGDKQAQQQLQQMANRMMQQMNNGQGPSPQQQQQMQSLLQQMQMRAQGQAQAQQLAQNANQLAKAMQQAAQQQQPQQGQPGQQQQKTGQPQQAKSGNQQQPGGQQGQGSQQQQQQQAQAQAQQQMKQQVQQMKAMADASQQGGQGNQAGQQGGQQGQGGSESGGAQQADAGQGQGQGGGEGNEFKLGDPTGRQGGEGQGGGPGQASGARPKPQVAPFAVKTELSHSDTIDKGKILASSFVKADALKGESKSQIQDVPQASETELTDEVDNSRVSRQAREAVKEYHRAINKDAEGAAAAPAK